MSVKIDENFEKEKLIDKLKTLDHNDGLWMIPLVEFVFETYANDLFRILHREFRSTQGNPAYDRRKLFLALSYAIRFAVDHDLTKVARLCRTDKVLEIILGEDRPCGLTFENFLLKSEPAVLKRLSICTVMELNDLELLDFSRLFTDSSDAKINGSVHYKVNKMDIECVKLMKELGLLHDRSHKKKMKLNRRKLLKVRKENSEDIEMVKLIDHILENFKLYDKRVYMKLDEIEEYLDEDSDSYVCIMFFLNLNS